MRVTSTGSRHGNTVLLDFGQIERLSLSVATYTMDSESDEDDSFIARVANLLPWPGQLQYGLDGQSL